MFGVGLLGAGATVGGKASAAEESKVTDADRAAVIGSLTAWKSAHEAGVICIDFDGTIDRNFSGASFNNANFYNAELLRVLLNEASILGIKVAIVSKGYETNIRDGFERHGFAKADIPIIIARTDYGDPLPDKTDMMLRYLGEDAMKQSVLIDDDSQNKGPYFFIQVDKSKGLDLRAILRLRHPEAPSSKPSQGRARIESAPAVFAFSGKVSPSTPEVPSSAGISSPFSGLGLRRIEEDTTSSSPTFKLKAPPKGSRKSPAGKTTASQPRFDVTSPGPDSPESGIVLSPIPKRPTGSGPSAKGLLARRRSAPAELRLKLPIPKEE